MLRRRNPNCGATLNISDPYSLGRSNFNGRYPTVIFIHGYSESATGRSAVAIRDGTFALVITPPIHDPTNFQLNITPILLSSFDQRERNNV